MVEFGFQLRAVEGIAEPVPIKGATGEAQFADEGLGHCLAHGFEIDTKLGRAAFAFPLLLVDGIGDARRRLAAWASATCTWRKGLFSYLPTV